MGFLNYFKTSENIVGHCFVCNAPIREKINQGNGAVISKPQYPLADNKYICPICAFEKGVDAKHIAKATTNSLLVLFKKNSLSTPDEFSPTKRVVRSTCAFGDGSAVPLKYSYLEIDDKNGLINLPTVDVHLIGKNEYHENIRSISSLIDFQLIDSGQKVVDGGSLAGAALGGVAFGGIGAIVGSSLRNKKVQDTCTDLSIKLIFNDISRSTEYIYFIGGNSSTEKVKRGAKGFDQLYELAQECLSILTVVCKNNSSPAAPSTDIADSIKKLADLCAVGILTEEEFSAKKSELLARI